MDSGLETSDLVTKTVLWPALVEDRYGNMTVGEPDEILTRWERRKSRTTNPTKDTQRADVTVYVGQEIALGSLLWEGAKADLPQSPSPLYVVVEYGETDDVKSYYKRRYVLANKYHGTIPGGPP